MQRLLALPQAPDHGRPQLFWKGGGGGQDRARGAPFDSREYVVRFRPIQQAGGGGGWVGGGAVRFRPIQRVGGGGGRGCCPLSAHSISEVSALSADPVIQSVGGGC